MAPVKISSVVSFSSQDPKFPVQNLLHADASRPWLCCPRDRRRELRAELQLERAVPIGYVDVGNCGCAFLHLDVGRSWWPRDRPYLALLPGAALMSAAEARLGQNRCGVRMFKEADFLEPALGQRWDRLRLTLRQPFGRHSQFGLSFLRVRTALDPQHPEGSQPTDSACGSSPALSRAPLPAPPSSRREGEEEELRLKRLLAQLEPSCLSRPARMLLSAARSRALRSRASPGAAPELRDRDAGGSPARGSAQGVPRRAPRDSRQGAPSRSLPGPSRAGARPRARRQRAGPSRRGDGETGVCPICSARFSLELLPTHASSCGEDADGVPPPLEPPWLPCPICARPCSAAELQPHASTCGGL